MRELDRDARWALVLWPDAYDQTLPSCIPLSDLPNARQRHAVIVGCEFESEGVPVEKPNFDITGCGGD